MPDVRMNAAGALVGQASREFSSLFNSELWWRDHYRELESRGYKLRPRYRPDWEPSWKQSGVDFFRVEDGQPTLVGIVSPMPSMIKLALVAYRNRRNVQGERKASHAQEHSCKKRTAGTGDRPAVLFTGPQARAPQPLRAIARNS